MIIKHKGPAKDLVSSVWFDDILSEIYKKDKIMKSSSFQINWNNLNIMKKETHINLGLTEIKVFNENNIWIDTLPVEVKNYGGNEEAILMFEFDKMEKLIMENDKKNKQMRYEIMNKTKSNDILIKEIEKLKSSKNIKDINIKNKVKNK